MLCSPYTLGLVLPLQRIPLPLRLDLLAITALKKPWRIEKKRKERKANSGILPVHPPGAPSLLHISKYSAALRTSSVYIGRAASASRLERMTEF